jgi:hypothetical protein
MQGLMQRNTIIAGALAALAMGGALAVTGGAQTPANGKLVTKN